ncbi:MAG TPA: hypothetical protein PLF03_06000 [Candidatus Omnitrophota bacterium]|nr:hypothetical protein [Candidatus Omnitrophota bacterium]
MEKPGVEKAGCREETCGATKLRRDGGLKLLNALAAGWVKLGLENEFAGWERVRLAGLEKLIPVDCNLSPEDEVEVDDEVKVDDVPQDGALKSKAWAGMV